MSESVHREVFENLAAYVLGALPLEDRAHTAAHLEECPVCAEDAAGLQRAATRLSERVPQVAPPPELRDRIMAVVESEASLLNPTRATPAPSRRRTSPAPRWAATAAALALGVGVGAVVLGDRGDTGPDTRTLSANVGRGHAWVEVTDDQAHLVVDGLAAPDKGKVYELWIQSGDEAPRPASDDIDEALFVVQRGRVAIPARLSEGDRVMVTEEPAGGSGVPTAQPVVVTARV